MSQNEELHEIELVDIIHFFVERLKRMLVVMLVVSCIVFGGVVAKNINAQNVSVVQAGGAGVEEHEKTYEAIALLELAQIILHGGEIRPIVDPNVLIAAFQSELVTLSVAPGTLGGNPPNSLWVKVVNGNKSTAEVLIKNTTKKMISRAQEKEQAAKENKNKAYSVLGKTNIAKYEVIEREPLAKPVFQVQMLLKTAFISLVVGLLVSLFYAGVEKILVDYRAKYSS